MPNEQNIEKHKFAPGQSGNPNGRPKGSKNSKTILNMFLGAPVKVVNPLTQEDDVVPAAQAIMIALIGKALKGDVGAAKEVFDRFEGRSNQRVELSNPEGDLRPVTPNVNVIDVKTLDFDTLIKLDEAYRQQNSDQPVDVPVRDTKATRTAVTKTGAAGKGKAKGAGKANSTAGKKK